jgi:hypothetical protein
MGQTEALKVLFAHEQKGSTIKHGQFRDLNTRVHRH